MQTDWRAGRVVILKNKVIWNEIQSTCQCLALTRKRQISPQSIKRFTAEAFCTIQKNLFTAIITIESLEAASARLSSDWQRQTSWEQETAYKQLKDREELVRRHSTGQTRGKYSSHGENPNKTHRRVKFTLVFQNIKWRLPNCICWNKCVTHGLSEAVWLFNQLHWSFFSTVPLYEVHGISGNCNYFEAYVLVQY